MDVFRGKIKSFYGVWGSGLGYLLIEDECGSQFHVPCDNGATVRALEGAFGNVIGTGHTVLTPEDAGYFDREVYWSFDELGLILEAFTPVEAASQELIAFYEAERE